jgi:hypothetical protein
VTTFPTLACSFRMILFQQVPLRFNQIRVIVEDEDVWQSDSHGCLLEWTENTAIINSRTFDGTG